MLGAQALLELRPQHAPLAGATPTSPARESWEARVGDIFGSESVFLQSLLCSVTCNARKFMMSVPSQICPVLVLPQVMLCWLKRVLLAPGPHGRLPRHPEV